MFTFVLINHLTEFSTARPIQRNGQMPLNITSAPWMWKFQSSLKSSKYAILEALDKAKDISTGGGGIHEMTAACPFWPTPLGPWTSIRPGVTIFKRQLLSHFFPRAVSWMPHKFWCIHILHNYNGMDIQWLVNMLTWRMWCLDTELGYCEGQLNDSKWDTQVFTKSDQYTKPRDPCTMHGCIYTTEHEVSSCFSGMSWNAMEQWCQWSRLWYSER